MGESSHICKKRYKSIAFSKVSCDDNTNHWYFFLDYVFFTDWRLGAIVRVRKMDGGDMRVIRSGITNIMHVKSYDANTQTGEVAKFFYMVVFCLIWWLLYFLVCMI